MENRATTSRVSAPVAGRRQRLRRLLSNPGPQSWASLSPRAVILLGLWFGLATGLSELALIVLRKQFVDAAALGALQLNRHAVWMIPASDALILGAAGAILSLGRVFRIKGTSLLAVFGLGFLSAMALLLTFRGLTTITYTLLAAGIAARLSPRILGHWETSGKIVRRSLPVLAGSLAALIGIELGRESSAEHRALANLPAPPAGAPNVLFIVLDTVRAESLSLYGYHRPTSPNLARLAERGVRFDRARTSASWTLPSHASMFTGRWPHELSARIDRPLDASFPTLAEYLRDRGYATAGFIANTFFCNGWYGLGRGFLHYEDTAVTPIEIVRNSGLGRRIVKAVDRSPRDRPGAFFQRKDAPTINREVLSWIDHRPADRPFFAFLNYYDAHDPYLTPVKHARGFGLRPASRADYKTLQDWHRIDKHKLTPHDVELARDCYDDCIAYLDGQLGLLFAELDRRGLLETTWVVVTSDHGEEFGERKGFGHGQSLHHEVIHVPLVIAAPTRRLAGRSVSAPVSLRDLPATIVDLLDLESGSPFPGRSWARHWASPGVGGESGDTGPGEAFLTEIIDREPHSPADWKPPRSVVFDEILYIRNGDGREELYDLAADPAEEDDLAGSSHARPELERGRAELGRLVPGETPPR
jgi:arylsulfatase A-like enzyme